MASFQDFNLSKQLQNSIAELGFETPTPIQIQAFPVIMSGKNVVGIAQTGTGKTLAYMLPILQELKYSKQVNPRILVLVPTRELVRQVVENIESYTKYMNVQVLGIYGGVNINTQGLTVAQGADIFVATPRRLYDLVLGGITQLKAIKKLVIDEVDVMLDLGFRFQLTNLFELLPKRRQNILFSATMTDDIDRLIEDYFIAPKKITVALSGTPLDNISQQCYQVLNFYTKVNLLAHLLKDKSAYSKVLVFVDSKKSADRLFEKMEDKYGTETSVIHSNKSQNYRIRSIDEFNNGDSRILITSDVMARGLDLEKITHVVNVNTPNFPENYIHRIGRTGRAKEKGQSLLFFTEKETKAKEAIEALMDYKIPLIDFPEEVLINYELLPEEHETTTIKKNPDRNVKKVTTGASFHEKKEKNKKTNQGGSYRRKLAKKYKKPKTRGDKYRTGKK